MTENVESPIRTLVEGLDLEAVGTWLEQQRWYASKSRHVTGIEIDEWIPIAESPAPLVLVLVQARFASGSHELYQLLISFVPESEVGENRVIVRGGGRAAIDAVADPDLVRDLLRLIDSEALIETEEGSFRFQRVEL
ncbi:MAG: maltokinase, partial [Solirubrobacteraceae bacterium]|nr:maltokinase [Solirubrobacteraceae bacterium]